MNYALTSMLILFVALPSVCAIQLGVNSGESGSRLTQHHHRAHPKLPLHAHFSKAHRARRLQTLHRDRPLQRPHAPFTRRTKTLTRRTRSKYTRDNNWGLSEAPHLVVARCAEDCAWVKTLDLPYTIMQADDEEKCPRDPDLQNVELRPNAGHEASAYLQFMMSHYDDLPATMIFTHADFDSWHQHGSMDILIPRKLAEMQDMQLDYVTLNNFYSDGRGRLVTNIPLKGAVTDVNPNRGLTEPNEVFRDFFNTAVRPFYAVEPEYSNVRLDNGLCAQFVVKRHLLSGIPKDVIGTWVRWLEKAHENNLGINMDNDGFQRMADHWSDDWTGRYFEMYWPFILNPYNLRSKKKHHLANVTEVSEPEFSHLEEFSDHVEALRKTRMRSWMKVHHHSHNGVMTVM